MKTRTIYVCTSCGAQSTRWAGQCPTCKEWNCLTEEVVAAPAKGKGAAPLAPGKAQSLAGLDASPHAARPTGMAELDRFLGKGLVPGGAILLGGEPGIGKSTFLLQLCGLIADQDQRVLYVTGEESLPQLKGRAERLGTLAPSLLALASNSADEAAAAMRADKPALAVIDSVQTMASSLADGLPGSVSQVRAVSAQLVEEAKKGDTALVLVGHVTKDGQIAGPKLMEHMVDTVLYLEGDRRHVFRILRVLKNRFGPSDELIVFSMGEQGLAVVPDPSTFFLGARDASLSGTAVVMAMDGQKPFAVEVQALAGQSFLSIPRRAAMGFPANRLHLLLAVLEKHLKLNFGQSDIYAKIGGGLTLSEPGLDLGLVAAVLSSHYDLPLPEGAVFWGEVDLNGQIRPCQGHEIRYKQAKRLGYGPIMHPGSGKKGVKRLSDFQAALFGSGRAATDRAAARTKAAHARKGESDMPSSTSDAPGEEG
ncbi:DNA repair protein RadA [Desulfovibrio sp. X2]|uniref:DNA repair protein RadA n=1 Tax=Desulfovibrio sp. X2 TaxID=941449 RepID=UPI000358D8C4|nr:DNA repair protein RadA [Desulfovibrio sp. X2]EPR37567.1 DNA repair protein RadA [Desulfovibrio sp. X2]